ncbi:ribonuclease H [Senna tora]|uniref:Ribonuclease H n=1 Tax=Senna tora TaxID=362788 RepID=A0A834SEK6_9FABA|nr:ribonuclease H [Senna tora]
MSEMITCPPTPQYLLPANLDRSYQRMMVHSLLLFIIKTECAPSDQRERQGDPISPYIYILCSNILSCMIRKQKVAKLWKGVKIGRNAVPLTHLMYADDTLLFFQANEHNLRAVNSVLAEYAELAGQKMNGHKSFLVFSPNIRHNKKKEMADFFNLKFHSTLGKYLGTYIDCKESKSHVIQDTLNKIESKLKVWKSKLLSQAARLTLIKSVINSYLVYPFSCMQFPKDKCKRIEGLMSNFFWGHNGSSPKLHLQNWSHLCKSKDMGDLALCDVKAFNEALMGKQLWRTMNNNKSLASSILTSKYVNADGNLVVPSSASWRWKAIFRSKEVVVSNLEWQIGDGKSIKSNHLAWWPMLRDQQLVSTVADLIKHNGTWNTSLPNKVYDTHTAGVIANTPISVTGMKDKLVWIGASDGQYTVKYVYNWIMAKRSVDTLSDPSIIPPLVNSPLWKVIWKFKLPFRIIMFLWRIAKSYFSALSLCKSNLVWYSLGYKPPDYDISLFQWFNDCFVSIKKEDQYILPFMAVVLQVLWRCRNLKVMEGKKVDPYSAINMIYSMWNLYAQSFDNCEKINNHASQPSKHNNCSKLTACPIRESQLSQPLIDPEIFEEFSLKSLPIEKSCYMQFIRFGSKKISRS